MFVTKYNDEHEQLLMAARKTSSRSTFLSVKNCRQGQTRCVSVLALWRMGKMCTENFALTNMVNSAETFVCGVVCFWGTEYVLLNLTSDLCQLRAQKERDANWVSLTDLDLLLNGVIKSVCLAVSPPSFAPAIPIYACTVSSFAPCRVDPQWRRRATACHACRGLLRTFQTDLFSSR